MKNKTVQRTLILSLAFLIFFITACDKNDDPTPRPSPQENYSVNYTLNLTGEYDELILVYYSPGSVKNILTSINQPWEMESGNFKVGDTVLFDLSFNTRPFKEIGYQYSVTVNKDGEYIAGTSVSPVISAADTTLPVHVHWQHVIGGS